ncbi:MAG: alpha/beta fold hydrolase [candidate division NC10 bacterium]|nr:alpha/beta fold hydrolase [candidate division NC10 bacterium]
MTAVIERGWILSTALYVVAGISFAGCAGTDPYGGTGPVRLSEVVTELVQVTTADGVRLDGALWSPAGGPGRKPALLLVHGYAGNFYTGWPGLTRGLAQKGHLTLALNMRDHDLTPQTSLFEDNRADIEAGVNLLMARGAASVVLVGQSLGTNRVLFYQADTQDPRVRGLVLMAGPGNLLEWNIRIFGREPALAVLVEAQRRVQMGRGAELILVDLGPLGKVLYSAQHLVSLRGPGTRSDPFQNIARVNVPILILHGTADRLADPAVAERLRAAAVATPSVQPYMIPGAGHALPERVEDILPILGQWLEAISK